MTLRGRVLPIGGLKEKALAALRAGINRIIIPDQNKKDLVEIPKEIREKMKFFPVKDMDEVVAIALGAGAGVGSNGHLKVDAKVDPAGAKTKVKAKVKAKVKPRAGAGGAATRAVKKK